MKILIKEYPLISHYSEPYNITSHKFSCYECGHVFVKHYIEDVTFKSNENKSFICDNCKNKAIKNLFHLNYGANYNIYYSHYSQKFFVKDENLIKIGEYINNRFIATQQFCKLKITTPILARLEMIFSELPLKLGNWYHFDNEGEHYFEGFEYRFSVTNKSFGSLLSSIKSNLRGTTTPYNNITKSISNLGEDYILTWNFKNEPINNNYFNSLIEINTETQEISYNRTIIAFYEKMKKKKIVISWLNDVNLDELNPDDIINAMDKIYPKSDIKFYDENDLV